MRKIALALGLAGLAFVVARRARSDDGGIAPDGVRERVADAAPDAVTERVGGQSGGAPADEWAEQGAREPGGGVGSGRESLSPSSIAAEESTPVESTSGTESVDDERVGGNETDAASEDER